MKKHLNFLLFSFMALQWGAAFVMIGVVSREAAPMAAAAVRIVIALATVTLIVTALKYRISFKKPEAGKLILLGITAMGVPWLVLFKAGTYVSGSVMALTISFTPILVLTFNSILNRSLPTAMKIVGLVIGYAGVATLLLPNILREGFSGSVWGVLLTLVAALSYASYSVAFERVKLNISVIEATFYQIFGAALIFLPTAFFSGADFNLNWSLTTWGFILILGSSSSVLGFIVFSHLIRTWGSTETITVDYLIPVIALLIESFFMHTLLPPTVLGGGVLILLGLAISQHGEVITDWFRRECVKGELTCKTSPTI